VAVGVAVTGSFVRGTGALVSRVFPRAQSLRSARGSRHTSARHVPAGTAVSRTRWRWRAPAFSARCRTRATVSDRSPRNCARTVRAPTLRLPWLTTVNVIASREALTRSTATSARASGTTSPPAINASRHGRK
jgi:hypothetical protein